MDLKGHIKRHSACILDELDAITYTDDKLSCFPRGMLGDKRPAQMLPPQTGKKARREQESATGGTDDCELLTGPVQQGTLPVDSNKDDDDDDDDVVITGVSGCWALTDLPHRRDQCGVFAFVRGTCPQNQRCCKQCYCYVCDVPQSECTRWGSGNHIDDHCNAFDSPDWEEEKAATRELDGLEPFDFLGSEEDLDREGCFREYVPLGTVCIPVTARGEYDLVNLPPAFSSVTMDLFHKGPWTTAKTGQYKPVNEMKYVSLLTGEQHLPRGERPEEKKLEKLIAEISDLSVGSIHDEYSEVQVYLMVHPSEASARHGVVEIEVSLQRSLMDMECPVELDKVLTHLCKDSAPALLEHMNKLRRLEQNDSVKGIRSFNDLLAQVQTSSTAEAEQPDGLADSVALRPYQKQSLRFMLDSERREAGFHGLIWHMVPGAGTLEEDVFYCPMLRTFKLVPKGDALPATTGGFLCEEMGFGKTVEILALTLANPHPNPPDLPPGPVPRGRRLSPLPEGGVPSKATLVVCAVSLVGQWMNEIQSKLKGPISVYKYHGSSRATDPFFLASHDIVITTYGILGKDYGCLFGAIADGQMLTDEEEARLSPLHAIKWWRVVLDESHTVKDPKVQQSRASAELDSDRRWCCTGTPINTSIMDLYGQFVFLKLDPFDRRSTFTTDIAQPFEKLARSGEWDLYGKSKAMLVFLMQKVMVRHTKAQKINGEKLLVLPPKTQVDMPVRFSPEERAVYDRAAAEAKKRFETRFLKMGPEYIAKHMLQIMALLFPLRRICSGGEINLPTSSDSPAPENGKEEEPISAGLQELPETADRAPESECGVCSEVMERPARTPCNHWFCHECLTGALDLGPSKDRCPVCRQAVAIADVILGEIAVTSTAMVAHTGSASDGGDAGAGPAAASFVAESKLNALLKDLEKTRETDPTAKALIFSQFIGTIDWLKVRLTEAGVKYRYISGDMALSKRAQAIEQFQQDPPTTVFLLSIRTGAVGITLTSASVVYLLEPVLNPALEDQAVGRAWRMGQQRPVTVKRMFVEDSVEEKILQVVKSRVEGGGSVQAAGYADQQLMAAYKSKGKTIRPETLAGSIRSDKQILRMGEFEVLFS